MKKAVILAAGRGTRMGDLTAELPKPMLPLAGKPLLEHILDRMRTAGVEEALVVTGFRAEVIEEHFRDYRLQIEYRRQEKLDGTGSATLLAREFAAQDPVLFSFGDILVEPDDYLNISAQLTARHETKTVVGVKHVDDPYQGAAVYEEDGRVTRIIEKPPRGSSTTNWNSAGLYAFRPTVFEYLARIPKSPRGEYELTTAIEQMLDDGLRLEHYSIEGAWRDVGRPDDIAAAETML
jgi:dTDP-glucose pyrophosphorylase